MKSLAYSGWVMAKAWNSSEKATVKKNEGPAEGTDRFLSRRRVYSLKVMKPEASASISLNSLAMFMSDTPRAERSRAANSSLVMRSSLSVSNSCAREEKMSCTNGLTKGYNKTRFNK